MHKTVAALEMAWISNRFWEWILSCVIFRLLLDDVFIPSSFFVKLEINIYINKALFIVSKTGRVGFVLHDVLATSTQARATSICMISCMPPESHSILSVWINAHSPPQLSIIWNIVISVRSALTADWSNEKFIYKKFNLMVQSHSRRSDEGKEENLFALSKYWLWGSGEFSIFSVS